MAEVTTPAITINTDTHATTTTNIGVNTTPNTGANTEDTTGASSAPTSASQAPSGQPYRVLLTSHQEKVGTRRHAPLVSTISRSLRRLGGSECTDVGGDEGTDVDGDGDEAGAAEGGVDVEDTVFDIKVSFDPSIDSEPDYATHKLMLEEGEDTVDAIFSQRSMFRRKLYLPIDAERVIQDRRAKGTNTFPVEYTSSSQIYDNAFPRTTGKGEELHPMQGLSEQFIRDREALSGDTRYSRLPPKGAPTKLLRRGGSTTANNNSTRG